jgi:osmoprotectant transport system substrate-binding protein
MRCRRAPTIAIAALLAASACARGSSRGDDALADDAVSVASFNFPESVLVAEIYAQAMEGAGFRVEREFGLGTRELVVPALAGGLVEFVPEYAGSALEFLAGAGTSSADPETTHRALVAQLRKRGVDVLAASPAEDQNGFAVTSETAERYGLRTLSDLSSVAPDLVFGGPPECTRRPLCLLGLASTYDIGFDDVVALDAGGPLTVSALAGGVVDVALVFTSDGAIEKHGFVLLHDDRHLQPAENVTPVIRADTLARFGPELGRVVNAVSAALSTAELRTMNADVARGANPVDVAAEWISANGLSPGLE